MADPRIPIASEAAHVRASRDGACAIPTLSPQLAQERRDVDVVVGDLERRALAVADARAAVGARCAALAARAATGAVVEAGADDGHADVVAHALVDHGAEDDVGVRVGGVLDDLGGVVDLEQPEVVARR